MKQLIFINLLISMSICIDECLQLTSHKKCISTINLSCIWTGQFCRESNNYLLGCDEKISQRLCLKQLGFMNGTVTKCIFDDHCHNIYDSHTLLCTNLLSKSACLSITNPQQFCQWKNGECINLSNEEINTLSSKFENLELSASACGLINGYLIIHSSILWGLIDYIPNLEIEFTPQEIYMGTEEDQRLHDNYVDSSGQFIWYTVETQFTPTSLKINDHTRYGCIAQEILKDQKFLKLFDNPVTRGVNHVYCKYLNKHPTNPILTIFVNNECIQVQEDELQTLTINCESMGAIVCQRYFNFNQICTINSIYEYECQETQNSYQSDFCQENLGTATHQICSQVNKKMCYLEFDVKGFCTNICSQAFNQKDCDNSGKCFWLGQNLNHILDSSNSQFIVCAPIKICDQLGLNQLYCNKLAANCFWDENQQRCKSIQHIELLFCSDCNTLYCCSSIIRADQYCIWNNNECLNVKDQPLFSHFLSFPQNITMNSNLCLSQTGQFNYYDLETKTCKISTNLYIECVKFDDLDFEIDGKECNNDITNRINKEYCLQLVNQYTRWDIFKQKCIHVTNTNLNCDSMILVNQNLCKMATKKENQLCLYDIDSWSCYSSKLIKLHCNTYGISKDQCVNILDEYCIWINNKCEYINPYQISLEQCEYLQNVTPSVCRIASIVNQCIYNDHSCQINVNQLNSCDGNWNAIACQQSQGTCYFDNITFKCTDATSLLQIIECDTEYISKQTCLSIITEGQRCVWSTTHYDQVMKCRKYISEFYTTCESYSNISNKYLCSALTANIQQRIDFNQQCEVINSVCQSNTTPIPDQDCGYNNRNMNVYRCMGFTSEECYFNNYKCTPIPQQMNYRQLLLKQMACDQSNMLICNQILTQGQVCFKEKDKCNIFQTLIVYSCSELNQFDMTIYSPQLCSIASDACYFNQTTKKCEVPLNDQYDCDQIGASKQMCIGFTKGYCAFITNYCSQNESKTTICENRNKKACFNGGLNCTWDYQLKMCIQGISYCPAQYTNSFQWQICGSSTSKCFAGRNGCVQIDSKYIPCWLSLSQTSCINSSQYCQWINNSCFDLEYNCEDANTFEKCIFHRQRKCVYKNNKCFEIKIPDIYNCDEFDYTTPLFCRYYYPKCIYKSQYQCQFVYHLGDSKQKDMEKLIYSDFASQIPQYSCLLQRSVSHYYKIPYSSSSYCHTTVQVTHTQCPYFSQTSLSSILTCESAPNCGFSMTLAGEPFCHPLHLACEQLIPSFCLKDIPGIQCYLDKSKQLCKTYTGQMTCSSVEGLQVNRELCLSINSECYYDDTNKLCKTLKNLQTDCSLITDYYACMFTSKSCTITYGSNELFSSCNISLNQFDSNLNLFGCTQLIDNSYYFSINSYTCKLFTEYDASEVINCHLLNQNACKSAMIDQKCVWFNNKCEKFQIKHELIDCQYRNYESCIESTSKSCVFIQNQCVESNECHTQECNYSESYCRSINQLWDGLNCYQQFQELPISFYNCSGLGLNQQLCLENTVNLKCYWDGFKCMDAILEILNCDQSVSKSTCLSITTPQQACLWVNGCINTYDSNQCNQFKNLWTCRQAKVSCEFNLASHQCIDTQQPELCLDTLSQKACENVINDFCTWNNRQCQRWPKIRYSCQQIYNKWGCLNSVMYCKWTNKCENINNFTPVPCKSLPSEFNKVACTKYATDQCLFDEQTQTCNIKLNSSFKLSSDQSQYNQIRLIYECTQFTNLYDCIGSRIGYCEWINEMCVNCQNTQCNNDSCNNKNIHQCMNQSNLTCAWRDEKCVMWIYNPDNTLVDLTLVTEQCCSKFNALIKYDKELNSCMEVDVVNDNCKTLGLSKYACLNLKKHQCTYQGFCQEYQFKDQDNCNDYINVTQYVCQQIPHLKCKFDQVNFKCVDFDQDSDVCLTIGLSIMGCTSITTQPCIWKTDSCLQFLPNPTLYQCDGSFQSNAFTCQLINTQECSYNFQYKSCQNRFNRYSKCSEPGLNLYSCAKTIREPCYYDGQKCQLIQSFESTCSLLINVNEMACKMNKKDSCAYDPISFNCYQALENLPCTFPGLNQNSCQNQQNCKWSYDYNTCQCSYLQISENCNQQEAYCSHVSTCRFEKYCRLQHCDDLKDCQGFVNKETCYLNYQNQCQGAQKCEDIINLSPEQNCNNFVFDNSNCIQITNYCVSANSYAKICLNSDCQNSYCKLSNSGCIQLQCSDYSLDECQFQNGCYVRDNQCQDIFSCSEIHTPDCINTKIDNFQCAWQISGVYSNEYHCTNNYCQLYSVSPSLCNGNEMNFHSCLMDSFLQCIMCEQITDQCECNTNSCQFENGKCKSVLCASFVSKETCLTTKCYWSNQDQVCRKICEFIIFEDECEALNYECYWNSYQSKCEQGTMQKPNLNIIITESNIYQPIIMSYLIILIIQ